MKFGTPATKRGAAAFTLAEVLAAMLFLALVIPAAVEALHVAGLAGEVAARKSAAARVADRVLNESLVLTNWTGGTHSGTIDENSPHTIGVTDAAGTSLFLVEMKNRSGYEIRDTSN